MARLYRVKWTNSHGETYTYTDGAPADVADQLYADFMLGRCEVYRWSRVWIETEDGRVIQSFDRGGVV